VAKRALLVGVNRYMIPGADLRGCVNDVKNLQSALKKYYGFTTSGIKTLLDLEAKKSKIEAGIKQLLKGAKAGDVLLLHFSGHGSHVLDLNNDEPDRRDEIVCPTDLNWSSPLTDDWLRTTFDGLKKGVNLTVIMDCCHSGTITRQVEPPDAKVINRFLPNPLDIFEIESCRKIKGRLHRKRTTKKSKTKGSLDVAIADIPELLITGCKDFQTSADALIAGSFNGALTYHLVKAIAEKKGKLTYRELHARTLELIKKGNYDQTPQLEGRQDNLDRLFLQPF
jgi:metacaspase-1